MTDNENQGTEEIQNKTQSESEKSPPLIKPGYDYIWGSDQDDLMEEEEGG